MKKMTVKLTTTAIGLALFLSLTLAALPTTASAQMLPWLQQEQARQLAERQQWMVWVQQEQARQLAERQQLVALQRQEQIRQMYERAQLLQYQQQEIVRQRCMRGF